MRISYQNAGAHAAVTTVIKLFQAGLKSLSQEVQVQAIYTYILTLTKNILYGKCNSKSNKTGFSLM